MRVLIRSQQTCRRLNRIKIRKAALKILYLLGHPTAELSIFFVDNEGMQWLNAAYRGIQKATDVLSFPQISGNLEIGNKKYSKNKKMFSTSHFSLFTSHFLLGDVVINIQIAASQARTLGTDFYYEIFHLLTHGILHLLGFDHEGSKSKAIIMRKKEREILNAIKKVG